MRSRRVLLVMEVIIYRILDQFTIAIYPVAYVEQLVYRVDYWHRLA